MGFGSFAGGLATGWMAASKQIEDEKNNEVLREARRLEIEAKRREADDRAAMDRAAGAMAQGGKQRDAYDVGGNVYRNEADANAAATNQREFDDMAAEYAVENPGSTVAPLAVGDASPKKTTELYSWSKAIEDARAAAGSNAKVLDHLDKREKLLRDEAYDKMIDVMRQTGSFEEGAKEFEKYGFAKVDPRWKGATYDSEKDALVLPGGKSVSVSEYMRRFISPEKQWHLQNEQRTSENKAENAALRADNQALNTSLRVAQFLNRGVPAGSGDRSKSGASSADDGGFKPASIEDFRKSMDPEKQGAPQADMAYMTYQKLRRFNPEIAATPDGDAQLRVVSNQYARGELQMEPQLGADMRWAGAIKGHGGNHYITDRYEHGIDPTSIQGKDGKPLFSAEKVAEHEQRVVQGVAKSRPDLYSAAEQYATKPEVQKNIKAAYEAAKNNPAIGRKDVEDLRSVMSLGGMIERSKARAAAEKPAASADQERFDIEVRAQRSFGRLTPEAMVRRGAELGIPAAKAELDRRRNSSAFQPQNAGQIGYAAP